MLINVTHDYALRMCCHLARKGGCASSREDGREKSREASRVSVAIVEALSRTTVEDVIA